jgi:biopolymer transport protein TolR
MHISSGNNGRRRKMTFELNLVPFIDVLSTCICFLLVTTVFMNLGSFNVNQAIGDAAKSKDDKKGSITVSLGSKGDVRFEMKNVAAYSGKNSIVTITGDRGQVNFDSTERFMKSFVSQVPNVKTALILPNPMTRYDDIIHMMSQLKKNSLDQIGIAPL